MIKPEYHEGPEALERFEKTLTALFRVPKAVVSETVKPAAKPKKASKG
jgi:hypothetical protein